MPESDRIYPFEFPWPVKCTVSGTIKLPEGHEATELPADSKTGIAGGGLEHARLAQTGHELLIWNESLVMNRIFYNPGEATDMRNFFELISAQDKQKIIITPTVDR